MIHKSSVIDIKSKIGKNVNIGPFCFVGPEVQIGDDVVVGANSGSMKSIATTALRLLAVTVKATEKEKDME